MSTIHNGLPPAEYVLVLFKLYTIYSPTDIIMASKEKNAAVIEVAKTLNNTPWCDEYEKMISGVA